MVVKIDQVSNLHTPIHLLAYGSQMQAVQNTTCILAMLSVDLVDSHGANQPLMNYNVTCIIASLTAMVMGHLRHYYVLTMGVMMYGTLASMSYLLLIPWELKEEILLA